MEADNQMFKKKNKSFSFPIILVPFSSAVTDDPLNSDVQYFSLGIAVHQERC